MSKPARKTLKPVKVVKMVGARRDRQINVGIVEIGVEKQAISRRIIVVPNCQQQIALGGIIVERRGQV